MEQPLKFVLVPMGSAGDVYPFVWLGKVLQSRGHDVVVIAQEMVRDMPERAGLRTVAWGDPAEQEEVIRNPDIWHPRKAFNLLAHYVPKWAGENLEVIHMEVEEGRTVMIGGALAYGARIGSERWGIPLLTVQLQPSIFMSVDDSPVMVAGAEWLPASPRWVRAGFFNMANWMADHKMGKILEQVRVEAGLPRAACGRVRGVMRSYWHSQEGVLCLFPEWFAHKAPDWPSQAILTRFPLYDGDEQWEDGGKLEALLAPSGGDREKGPVVITPGSANAFGERMIREALAGCELSGRKAIVVSRYTKQSGASPAAEAWLEYVPFKRLFPRAAAVIHHGGIGTTAQCFAAGVPQLIMPLSHDQPDNAARIRRMGVGDYIYPKAFRAKAVAQRLNDLIASPAVKTMCGAYRRQADLQMSDGAMGELIETLGERALRVRQINGVGVPW